ncbi:MAG: response regulator transcription factor, partial [Gammaproteobacteria bacterium]
AQWHSYHHRHPETVPVFVSSNQPADSDAVSLAKPLSFRHLEDIRYALRLVTPVDVIEAAEEEAGLHVLVVDDSATAREMMQAYLAEAATSNSMPVHIDFAISGEDALEKASHKHYDLVFLDVVMPGLDGYEVCRQLKERHISRIALLTGRGEAADYALGRAAGCDHYLAKPAPAAMVNTVVRLTAMKKAMPTH